VRRILVGTAAAAVVVLSGGAAAAAGQPAPDGDDGWAPVPEEYYAPVEVEACGSAVTIEAGDVREVEQRSEVLDDGTLFIEHRGGHTVDLTRQSDGAMVDELDVSGTVWDLVSADGTVVVAQLDGPALIWASNDVERAAADEAGLPHLFRYEEGSALVRLVLDPATGESVAVDVLRIDADVVDLCGAFGS